MALGSWANVSAVVLSGPASGSLGDRTESGAVGRLRDDVGGAQQWERFFTEVLFVEASPSPLAGLVCALESSSGERLVALGARASIAEPDLVLALMAWPEADAVVPVGCEEGDSLCAIYRREGVLPEARERLASGATVLGALHDSIATDRVTLEALGLQGWHLDRNAEKSSERTTVRSEAG